MKKALLILFVMLVLTACNTPSRPAPTASPSVAVSTVVTETFPTPTLATEIPYPAPTSSPDFSALPLPTTGPLPTDQPHPTETPEPLDLSGVWFAKLLNDQQGWVLSDGNLLWTDDLGKSWREMSPPNPNPGEGVIQNVFFLNPQQAWVMVCVSHPSTNLIKIMYTSDEGKSWEVSEVASLQDIEPISSIGRWCGRPDLGHIFFLNAQQGWVSVDHTTGHLNVGEMFQTLDGGKTWQHLGTSHAGEFYFTSDTTGWMFVLSYTPSQVYRTLDGGKTWQVVSLNETDKYDVLFLPTFIDQQVGIMAANLDDEEGITTFFKTQDGGESWEPIGKLTVLPVAGDLNIQPSDVEIWDEQTWVVTVPHYGVYWTLDGGQSWVENTNEMAQSIDAVATLGSATSGWGLKCDQGSWPYCLYLMSTEDMGAHWEKVEVQP